MKRWIGIAIVLGVGLASYALLILRGADARHCINAIRKSTSSEIFTLSPDYERNLGLHPGSSSRLPDELTCTDTLFQSYDIVTDRSLKAGDHVSLVGTLSSTLLPIKLGAPVCFTPGFGARFHTTDGDLDVLLCYDCTNSLARRTDGSYCWLSLSREKRLIISDLG
jgi:hypothetical protein